MIYAELAETLQGTDAMVSKSSTQAPVSSLPLMENTVYATPFKRGEKDQAFVAVLNSKRPSHSTLLMFLFQIERASVDVSKFMLFCLRCPSFGYRMGVEKVAAYDTAGSAKMIAEGNLENCAAIASDLAAEAWGMEVLASNIEDDHVNFTRFLLLARQVGSWMLVFVQYVSRDGETKKYVPQPQVVELLLEWA